MQRLWVVDLLVRSLTYGHQLQRQVGNGRAAPCDTSAFYQRGSTASYASTDIARADMSVRPSVCLSVALMISSPTESQNVLVFANIRFIPQFERGHFERWRFMRLGWVRTGDFKPPYLRNDARQDQGCY